MGMNDMLGNRMKRYEAVPQNTLMRRTPVAIRNDGKAFHTFTKHLKKPWDDIFQKSMQSTLSYLCANIQGCVFGYQQSDEITLILTDYDTLTTDAWFGYEVQKLCSVSASMATMKFNQIFNQLVMEHRADLAELQFYSDSKIDSKEWDYMNALYKASQLGATFDARCFNIPKEEVTNLIFWRQVDAIRNSIQSMGQANFSHSELNGKSTQQIREMLAAIGNPWEDIPGYQQHGIACFKDEEGWHIDYCMPILKYDNREYLEKLI